MLRSIQTAVNDAGSAADGFVANGNKLGSDIHPVALTIRSLRREKANSLPLSALPQGVANPVLLHKACSGVLIPPHRFHIPHRDKVSTSTALDSKNTYKYKK